MNNVQYISIHDLLVLEENSSWLYTDSYRSSQQKL